VSAQLNLTGSFDTTELPRIGPDPVTVTVERTVVRGREAEFEAAAVEIQTLLAAFPGFLGAGVLRPAPGGGQYQIVFRFIDALSLRRWERSPERAAWLDRLEPLVADTRVQRTVGIEEWFAAPQHVAPRQPLWRRIAGDVVWIYPLAAIVSVFLSPYLIDIPLLPRVLVTTTLITALATLFVHPVRVWNRRRRTL
jgi:uncharacterized protein